MDFIKCEDFDFYPSKSGGSKIRSLWCDSVITPSIQTTKNFCANHMATYSNIHFQIDANKRAKLFHVCYSKDVQETKFAVHQIHGESLNCKHLHSIFVMM